ncbi:MAG TPA: alanine--tRNA ligase-related protein, partial [Armatimonadota bacterium]|nr:alanine--tRNA ligase-related protein [Armatimonadota bacterium]
MLILAAIAEISGKRYGESEEVTKAFRIIADHMRCSTFIMGD